MTTELLNPYDVDLEEVVLGACLIESAAIALVEDKLRPEMFLCRNPSGGLCRSAKPA